MKRDESKKLNDTIKDITDAAHYRWANDVGYVANNPERVTKIVQSGTLMERCVLFAYLLDTIGYRVDNLRLYLDSLKCNILNDEGKELLITTFRRLGMLRSGESVKSLVIESGLPIDFCLKILQNSASNISYTTYFNIMDRLCEIHKDNIEEIIKFGSERMMTNAISKLTVMRKINKQLGKNQVIIEPTVSVQIPEHVKLLLELL